MKKKIKCLSHEYNIIKIINIYSNYQKCMLKKDIIQKNYYYLSFKISLIHYVYDYLF